MKRKILLVCEGTLFLTGLLGVSVIGVGMVCASDTGVQRHAVQQAIGTVFTFDMLQGGFRIFSSPAMFRSTFPVSGTVDLSDGAEPYTPKTLVLQRNLVLHDVATLASLGNITGNGYALELPKSVALFPVNMTTGMCTFSDLALVCRGDFTWQAPNITFSGNSLINGQGNRIMLADGIIITVAADTTLVLQDVVIKNLSSTNLVCAAPSSTIVLKNAALELADNVITVTGTIIVQDPSACILKDKNWTIAGDSSLTVSGVTLWKEQAGASTLGNITGNINLVNGGVILQQASGNMTLIQSEITALQASFAARRAPMRRRR